ncbi:hypothetical protein DIE04_23335 [Burkholderia sp. Bp8994]|nr:hypothetical protein DIE04_23335 [Burkholderia sp. Bp8994]RQS30488.1 hypothetical protein DIE05_10430 [Burkholderia sp. Bp8995]RQS40099.1 hypothetical protein DIE01_15065 [Burkholderia sp. Bp8990]RQS48798.1 hypothetical protein DIE00_10110 [Burkholderia sp. Bp8989]
MNRLRQPPSPLTERAYAIVPRGVVKTRAPRAARRSDAQRPDLRQSAPFDGVGQSSARWRRFV